MKTAPLNINETWNVREATLLGARSEALFAPLASHAEAGDLLIVHRGADDAEPLVMLPWQMWKRVLLTVAVASGESIERWVGADG